MYPSSHAKLIGHDSGEISVLGRRIPHHQQGFSLPVVVFILVIMALLAAGITQLSSRSNLAAAQEELSNRAFFAAESGASWAMSSLFFNAGGAADKAFSDAACTAVSGSVLNFARAGLATCSATLSCSNQALGTAGFYRLQSQGSCSTGQTKTFRTVEVGAKNGS